MTTYTWTDNAMRSGSTCDVDKVADNLMYLKDSAVNLSNLTATGKALIPHLAMPSGSYTTISLGSSCSTYTAPADGYITFGKRANGVNQFVALTGGSSGIVVLEYASSNYQDLYVYLPVSKDEVITYEYNAADITKVFRFIYAQGGV